MEKNGLWSGCKFIPPFWRTIWQYESKSCITFNSAILLLVTYPKEKKIRNSYSDVHHNVTTAIGQKQSRCSKYGVCKKKKKWFSKLPYMVRNIYVLLFTAVWPWTSNLTYLCLTCLICKLPDMVAVKMKWNEKKKRKKRKTPNILLSPQCKLAAINNRIPCND